MFPLCEREAVERDGGAVGVVGLPKRAELAWIGVHPMSGSVSLAMTSTVTEEFSVVSPESMTAEGPSLVPVTVMSRVPPEVAGVPSSSVTV